MQKSRVDTTFTTFSNCRLCCPLFVNSRMASSRPVRKRHSTVFYRDEPPEKPPPRRSLPARPPIDDTPSNIPEVLYAPDGRKFYPCKYCCRAFAFKKGQVSHIKACSYRVVEVSDDEAAATSLNRNAVKVNVSNNETKNLLAPIKFETDSNCPDFTPKHTKQKTNTKQTVKRKRADYPIIPAKRIKQETNEIPVMPVLKREIPTNHPSLSLNHSVSERVKNLDSVSLIPIKKTKPLVTVDIHKPTNCKLCKKTYPNALEYLRHKREVHLGGSMKLSPESLEVYSKIFLESDRTTCPICMKPTKMMTWRRHLWTHSTQTNYVCEFCKKGFNRIDHLRNHKKRHLQEMGEV